MMMSRDGAFGKLIAAADASRAVKARDVRWPGPRIMEDNPSLFCEARY